MQPTVSMVTSLHRENGLVKMIQPCRLLDLEWFQEALGGYLAVLVDDLVEAEVDRWYLEMTLVTDTIVLKHLLCFRACSAPWHIDGLHAMKLARRWLESSWTKG